jgi:hypothetical protein
VHHVFADNTDLVGQCIDYCENLGYVYSGVENASDCQCASALAGGVTFVDESECNSLCPEPAGVPGQEFCGGVERLMVYHYVG